MKWSERWGSNPRGLAPKASACPLGYVPIKFQELVYLVLDVKFSRVGVDGLPLDAMDPPTIRCQICVFFNVFLLSIFPLMLFSVYLKGDHLVFDCEVDEPATNGKITLILDAIVGQDAHEKSFGI